MKKVIKKIKLDLEAGKAVPSPSIGPILGSYGINIIAFCKEYNKRTETFKGLRIPASIIFSDPKNIKIKLHLPSLSFLISFFSSKNVISLHSIYKIISIKKKECYPMSDKKYFLSLFGTLKSMNIKLKK